MENCILSFNVKKEIFVFPELILLEMKAQQKEASCVGVSSLVAPAKNDQLPALTNTLNQHLQVGRTFSELRPLSEGCSEAR